MFLVRRDRCSLSATEICLTHSMNRHRNVGTAFLWTYTCFIALEHVHPVRAFELQRGTSWLVHTYRYVRSVCWACTPCITAALNICYINKRTLRVSVKSIWWCACVWLCSCLLCARMCSHTRDFGRFINKTYQADQHTHTHAEKRRDGECTSKIKRLSVATRKAAQQRTHWARVTAGAKESDDENDRRRDARHCRATFHSSVVKILENRKHRREFAVRACARIVSFLPRPSLLFASTRFRWRRNIVIVRHKRRCVDCYLLRTLRLGYLEDILRCEWVQETVDILRQW